MFLALAGANVMQSVGDAWIYLFNLTAGVGLVMILRWYWWRVNAWSEIVALCVSALVANLLIVFKVFDGDPNVTALRLLVTVPITTVVWLLVTFLTKPEAQATLLRFYERVRPSEAGWRPIARIAQPGTAGESLGLNALDWLAGCGLVYGALFGIGRIIFGDLLQGVAYLGLAVACASLIAYNVNRMRERQPAARSPLAGP